MRNHFTSGFMILFGVLALAVVAGCGRQAKQVPMPEDAVALVNGKPVTREAFESELARRGPGLAASGLTDAQVKQAVLENQVRFEAVHQKALAAGYDKDPRITAELRRMIVARYQEDREAELGPPGMTAEEIAAYYEAHPERFGRPERVRVALIELRAPRTATPEKRTEVAAKAAGIRAEAAAKGAEAGTFARLAQSYSEDQASRYQGGDIGWIVPGNTNVPWNPALLAAIARLKAPGEIGPVIETPAAFYIMKLLERQPAELKPLAEVRDGVEYLLRQEKQHLQQEKFYADIKRAVPIRTNEALLEQIEWPAAKGAPAAPPVGPTATAAANGPGQ